MTPEIQEDGLAATFTFRLNSCCMLLHPEETKPQTQHRNPEQLEVWPMTSTEWKDTSDVVHEILVTMFVQDRSRFLREAEKRGCTLEQAAAAAIAQMIRERVEQGTESKRSTSRRRPPSQ